MHRSKFYNNTVVFLCLLYIIQCVLSPNSYELNVLNDRCSMWRYYLINVYIKLCTQFLNIYFYKNSTKTYVLVFSPKLRTKKLLLEFAFRIAMLVYYGCVFINWFDWIGLEKQLFISSHLCTYRFAIIQWQPNTETN